MGQCLSDPLPVEDSSEGPVDEFEGPLRQLDYITFALKTQFNDLFHTFQHAYNLWEASWDRPAILASNQYVTSFPNLYYA